MALTSWKAFPFFTVSQIPVPADDDGSYVFDVFVLSPIWWPPSDDGQNEVTSLTTGSESIFLGTSQGSVRILSRSFKVVRSFPVADRPGASVTHVKQIPGTAYLVTISEDLSTEPSLKVWALDKMEKKTGAPRCLCTTTVQNGRRQFPVCARGGVAFPGWC